MQFNEHEAAFCRAASRLSWRDFLNRPGAGMGAIGLAGGLGDARAMDATAASPLFPKAPHFAPRARRVSLRSMGRPIHVRDMHATILNLMGLRDESLTFLHAGRIRKPTDIGGSVIQEIPA